MKFFIAIILSAFSPLLVWGEAAEITFSMRPVAAISPLLYGVNYTWNTVPAEHFPGWETAMRTIAHYRLVQYPGGWNPEHYDWQFNREPSWHYFGLTNGFNAATQQPGIDPEGLYSLAPAVNFVTPSQRAIADPTATATLVATSAELVRKYGNRVKLWDIGNEWWIQRGGMKIPAIRQQNI